MIWYIFLWKAVLDIKLRERPLFLETQKMMDFPDSDALTGFTHFDIS